MPVYIYATTEAVYATDGAAAGTTLVAEAPPPDALETAGDAISNVAAIGDNVSFAFNITGDGSVPFVTNGPQAGTSAEPSATLP
jgi:hypothetical protein